jgi:hypothetical protein
VRWPWHRRESRPSQEAQAALWQADRALTDAERLDRAAQEVADRLRETRRRNHFAEAVARSIRRT